MLALALGGCSSEVLRTQERLEQAYSVPPTDHRAEILSFMRTYLNDPAEVRDAHISEPARRDVDGVSRYVVCLRYNARGAGGRYAGSKVSMVLFRDGRLDRFVDNARDRCKDASFQQFPALQRLTR